MNVTFTLNGAERTFTCDPSTSLLRLLRSNGLFSVRFGSDDGQTGASAVLVDGKLANADVLLVPQVGGKSVTTVEGLAGVGTMHPIQSAFAATGAIQSGYSTPAMVLAAKELLDANPSPTEADVRDALAGIIDRETAYQKPVAAVLRAASLLRGEEPPAFEPEIVEALTEGQAPIEHDPNSLPILAPLSVPRLVPSADVPETTIVGKPQVKVDALKLAKGHAAFVDDIDIRGLLYAKVLRSPHAHARIADIDDSEALALPGVHAVVHHKNTSRVRYQSAGQSYPSPPPYDQVSFDNKVRHVGDRVAAVAAETIEIASEALTKIKVTYEILEPVFDENEAISGNAPVIHDEPDIDDAFDASRNIVHHIEAETGDVAKGLAEADKVYDQEYRVHQVHSTPIEPHISIAYWDSDERLVVRTSTQVPFHCRRKIARLLDLPIRKIRVIKPRVGGAFGAKQEVLIEDIVGHLAIATGRGVRLELTRQEEFESARTRHPETVRYRTGVNDDGSLVAQELRAIGNTGAYGTHGLTVLTVTGMRGLSSYAVPSKKFDCDVVYTNLPVPGAYRGYGTPQALFALESHMEDIASDRGMDPLDFKRQHWLRVGDPIEIAPLLGEGDAEMAEVPVVTSSGLEECVAQGQRAIGWNRRNDESWTNPPDQPNIRRGIGFGMCMHGTAIPGLDMGSCSIKMNDDGSFNVHVGATDLGTGSDTVLAQIAAEVLGVSIENILVYSSDTDMTPFDVGAYASSTTYISGTATKLAAEKVRTQIKERAAKMLEIEFPDTIELHDCQAWTTDGRHVSIEEVALNSLHEDEQHQIMGQASYVSPESPTPWAAQFVEVEVDVETGQVTAKKIVMAVDCGVAINPINASGQCEGAVMQSLGYAICEEMVYDDDGRCLNPEFGPYRVYHADEMPEIEIFLIQTMEASGPFGAKAVAEIGMDSIAPAVRAALLNATGVRMFQLPFTPERVWRALNETSA